MNAYKPFYKKLWFWVLIVVALGGPVIVYGPGYLEWKKNGGGGYTRNEAFEYWGELQARSDELKNKYKADEYGGDTPEETLKMFVEALENKDFKLASKYFIVEKQNDAYKENVEGEKGGNQAFINAYKNGKIVPPDGVGSSGIYEIEIYPSGDDVAFGVRLKQNPFTKKWKIIEL